MPETNKPFYVEEKLNPRVYFRLISKAWKWYALCFASCLLLGLAFLRYSTSIYTSSSTILIVEDDENVLLIRDAIDHQDKYSLARKTEAESVILKSRFLLNRVVKNQGLNKQIFSLTGRTKLKSTEAYQDPAFHIITVNNEDSILYNEQIEFTIHPVSSNQFELSSKSEKKSIIYINDTFNIGSVELQLKTTDNYDEHWLNYKYKVVVTPVDRVVSELQQQISINDEKQEVGVLIISLNGPTPKRNDDIINGLIQEYQSNSIYEKNRVTISTNEFLSSRISLIEKELSMIESSGESLKKENDVLDVDIQYSSILLKQNELEKYIVNAEVQLAVVQYVQEYVNEDGNKLVPVNLGLASTPLVKTITNYNNLYNEYIHLQETTGSKNPKIVNIQKELTSSKINLQESMNSLVLSEKLRLEELKTQHEIGEQKISLLPRFERNQRNIDRHKQIVESLYLFLLQKKEENEIILTSTIADSRVIDKAFSNPSPILPNTRIVYVLILIMSIAIPSIGLYLIYIFNDKVNSVDRFDSYKIPLFGEIANTKNKKTSYSKYLNNATSESFRVLRVHLSMLFDKEPSVCKTLLFTSLNSNEGKTFTAINLGRALSDINKKVLVIDFDLRTQGLMNDLRTDQYSLGLSEYLLNEQIKLNDIIIPSEEFEHLSFISSGATPQNPSELLSNPRVKNLFEEVKSIYDYVLIDTSSIKETIDTYLLVRHTDMTMLVCREGQLKIEELKIIREHMTERKLGEVNIIFNRYTNITTSFQSLYQRVISQLRTQIKNLTNKIKNTN